MTELESKSQYIDIINLNAKCKRTTFICISVYIYIYIRYSEYSGILYIYIYIYIYIYSRIHAIQTLMGGWHLFELHEFWNCRILGFLYLIVHENDGDCEETDTWYSISRLPVKFYLLFIWQYFSECTPFSLLWIFKCRSV